MGNRAIVWELALVVGAVVVFAVWQFVSLKRDGEALQRKRGAQSDPERTGMAPEQ